MYILKAKDSEIKSYPSCLGNTLKDFTIDNIKKTGLKGYAHGFCVDYIIKASNILDIPKYLMKITLKINTMFGFIKKNVYWIVKHLHSSPF